MVIEARDIMPHRATDRLAERMEGIIADLAGVESISVGDIALFLAIPNLNWAGYGLRDLLINKKVTRPPVETEIKKDLFNGTSVVTVYEVLKKPSARVGMGHIVRGSPVSVRDHVGIKPGAQRITCCMHSG